jgi:hypothetical protein
VIYSTDIEGLLFVPAGTGGESGPELLASRRMTQVCAELSAYVHDGVVLFDSSPMLLSNESQVLSRLVGQVLLVVRADYTEQRLVRRGHRPAGPHQAHQHGAEQRPAHRHRRRPDELRLRLRLRLSPALR